MKKISQITGWALIVLGILVMCGAVVFVIVRMAHTGRIQYFSRFFKPSITSFLSLVIGSVVFIHGIAITSLGEGLHLLVEIADKKVPKTSIKKK